MLGDRARGIWAMTFHAACARILRAEYPDIGRSGRFSIADSQDQVKIMKLCLKELISEKQYAPKGVLHAVSSAKDCLMSPEAYCQQGSPLYETKVAEAYALYQAKLTEMDTLDFDDLIVETVRLFQEHPHILRKYQERFRYISW